MQQRERRHNKPSRQRATGSQRLTVKERTGEEARGGERTRGERDQRRGQECRLRRPLSEQAVELHILRPHHMAPVMMREAGAKRAEANRVEAKRVEVKRGERHGTLMPATQVEWTNKRDDKQTLDKQTRRIASDKLHKIACVS